MNFGFPGLGFGFWVSFPGFLRVGFFLIICLSTFSGVFFGFGLQPTLWLL